MNNLIKALVAVPVGISRVYCSEITFPGFDSDGNDIVTEYFTFTGGGGGGNTV